MGAEWNFKTRERGLRETLSILSESLPLAKTPAGPLPAKPRTLSPKTHQMLGPRGEAHTQEKEPLTMPIVTEKQSPRISETLVGMLAMTKAW